MGSAFWGAFFAFVFMWVWDLIVRYRERWARHYRALVILEHSANDQLSALHTALFEIAGIKEAHAAAKERSQLPLYENCPEEIPIEPAFELDLANIDLLNDYVSQRYRVRSANRDIRRYAELLTTLQRALADGICPPREYGGHLDTLIGWLTKLERHIQATMEDTVTLAAKARVRSKRDRPRAVGLTMRFRRTRYEPDFTAAVVAERAVLMAEIEQVSAASQRDIDAAQGKGT